jgi:hypothetical protein
MEGNFAAWDVWKVDFFNNQELVAMHQIERFCVAMASAT